MSSGSARLKIGSACARASGASTTLNALPLGTTVSPAVASAARNIWYASALVIFAGAISVTLRPIGTVRGSSMNVLQVSAMPQVTSSRTSISGLNVIATFAAPSLQR